MKGELMIAISGLVSLITFSVAMCDHVNEADRAGPVLIYGGVATEVATAKPDGKDLWVTVADLNRAAKLELKPQGVCTEKSCIPLPEGRRREFVDEQSGTTWFNLSEFARLVRQPVAHDKKHQVWFFGPRPAEQNSHIASLTAPDFTLPDLDGKMHSLSEFRGKKVLLITWASW
jgi:hypothetical protein